jgi:glutaredoxin 3
MAKIVIYTKSNCPYCVKAKQLLNIKGAKYQEIDVGNDPEARSQLTIKANGRKTVPQIFIDDFHVGGCDDLMALNDAGKLDQLLK